MRALVKTTVMSLTLLAGVAAAAHAQSNVAALPPGAAPAVAPVGPAASAEWVGPKPGQGWYAKEQQSNAVPPSPAWIGPRAN